MNLYETLEVNTDASLGDIKKSFRKLSMKYHPDKNKNIDSITKFQQISHAYTLLSEPVTKYNYDMQYNLTKKISTPLKQTIVDNIVYDKPTTLIKHLNITIQQSFNGCDIPVSVDKKWVENNVNTEETETIYVRVPKGTDNNEVIIIKNKGHNINNVYGDVKIIIRIINDTPFIRDGLNLILNLSITLKESLCGVDFLVTHINGKKYKIISTLGDIIHPGSIKELHKLGFERDSFIGSLLIKFSIIFPNKLSDDITNKLSMIL